MSALVLPPPTPDTPEWEAWRDGGVGASEVPAVFGLGRFITERGLALEKRRLVPHRSSTTATRWGHRVERLAREVFEERTGVVLEPAQTFVNPRWPNLFATPDGLNRKARRLAEFKWTKEWDTPPRYVKVQCQTQMAIADADAVDLVRMGPYGEPEFIEVLRDESDIAGLDYVQEWYERFCEGDELPPEDGSPESIRYGESLLGPAPMDATEYQVGLMERLRIARQDTDAAEKEAGIVRDLLLRSMQGFDTVAGPGWRINYGRVKGRTRIDWEGIAAQYRALVERARPKSGAALCDDIAEANTATGEPSRSFRPTWK